MVKHGSSALHGDAYFVSDHLPLKNLLIILRWDKQCSWSGYLGPVSMKCVSLRGDCGFFVCFAVNLKNGAKPEDHCYAYEFLLINCSQLANRFKHTLTKE